jgi:periplasmic divalent cation tolerance protein
MASDYLIAFITSPDRATADRIADALVEGGHAACVNIIPGLTSVYYWQGEVHHDEEWLLLAKTTSRAWPKLEQCVADVHPDDVPEVVAAPLEHGLPSYLQWVREQTLHG